MKDLDSIKLKSEENDDLKYKSNFKSNKTDLFINNKILKNIIKYVTDNLVNICLLTKAILINIYGLYHYLYSLKGCKNSRAYCLHYYSMNKIDEIVVHVLKSGISYSLIFILAYWKLISPSNFFIITSTFLSLYLYDNGDNFENHGYYNFYGFIILIFLIIPVLLYITYIIKLILAKSYKMILCVLIPILINFLIVAIKYQYLLNCNGYHIGLNGMKIDDNKDKYSCFYDYPKKCYIDILSPFMDYSSFAGNCKTIRNLKEQKKYFTYFLIEEKDYKNTTRFGFPITTNEKYSLRTQNDIKHFNERVSKNIIDMDIYDKQETKNERPEVILDFSEDKNGIIKINIEKNKSLSEERKKLGEENRSKFDNILFIFIDSLSREHFKRKMKKTKRFIEQFMKKENDMDYKSYQFMKYTTFDAFTQMSAQPMFYGEKMDPETSNGTFILKYMKKTGYITGQSINLCSRELFVTMNNCLNKVEFSDFDHENVAMFCDANYYNRDNPYPLLQGGFSVLRRCLYGKDSFEYVLEYGQKFWETYKDNKKFLRLGFIDAHERTQEVIKYLDEPLFLFLNYLFKKKLLEKTAIFFVSDHGNGMYGLYRDLKADDFLFERTLAFWFMILHNFKKEEEMKNLEENQQTFLTPYDIFDTLSDIIFDEEIIDVHTRQDLGKSVFRTIDSKNRNCMKYSEWPLDEMCHCRIPGLNYSTPIGYNKTFLNQSEL